MYFLLSTNNIIIIHDTGKQHRHKTKIPGKEIMRRNKSIQHTQHRPPKFTTESDNQFNYIMNDNTN